MNHQLPINILSFDVEEWFHILNHTSTEKESDWKKYESRIHRNMEILLQLLESKHQKATFFCLAWIAEKYPEIIRQISASGHEVASHSYLHQLAYTQSPDEFQDDLKRSIQVLEDLIGKKISIYRAPGFSVTKDNLWVFEKLLEQGIEIDCSIKGRKGFGQFEKIAEPILIKTNQGILKEFPVSSVNILGNSVSFASGGYFRILPYYAIRSMMKSSLYVMTYFHPREFDPEQPVVENLSYMRRFKLYVGLKSALTKLDQLLTEFEFIDVTTAAQRINWSEVKQVSVIK